MWAYEVMDIDTGEVFVIEGVDFLDACMANELDPEFLEVLDEEPVDW